MQKIDINTTQNVTIQYELAAWKDRVFAYIIDMVVLFGSIFLIALMFELALPQLSTVIIVVLLFFYTPAFEIFNNGQSPGKKALGIKVVKLTGKKPTIKDYLFRWAFRIIDIYFSFGVIASVLIGSSAKGQRLGDLVANTTVIRVQPSLGVSLRDIMTINTQEHYQPVYKAASRFNEEEIILIKEVLDRVAKYPNTAHKMALKSLVDKVKERLDLEQAPLNQTKFLKTVIKDYVVLTR